MQSMAEHAATYVNTSRTVIGWLRDRSLRNSQKSKPRINAASNGDGFTVDSEVRLNRKAEASWHRLRPSRMNDDETHG
jgi:hypothetical protein